MNKELHAAIVHGSTALAVKKNAGKTRHTLNEIQERRKEQFYTLLKTFLPVDFIDRALAEYNRNDAAHLEDHAIAVVLNANDIVDKFPELKWHRRVILTAALLHDVRCHVNRDKHHILGALAVYREYLLAYPETKTMFSEHQITMVEQCVLEHRASWKHERSHNASECVAAADRGKPDLYNYMRRAVRFRYAQLPDGVSITDSIKHQIIDESIKHMQEKFGEKGYAWETMPKYTLLMYEAEIRAMKEAVEETTAVTHAEAFKRFDGWVV
ncbi:hypothetical protein ACSA002_0670 [Salmonella phage vB_SalM_SA002]|nr:hypothetical protein ACSA002_0670 [Salmonella phage vB_SalM_SA002]